MGVIKTALEIALKKTENVKSDKSSIDQFAMRQNGKKLGNAFLSENADLAEELKKSSVNHKESLKQGIYDVLVSQIALPAGEEDQIRLEKTGMGLAIIIENSRNKNEFNAIFKQLIQITGQFLQEVSNYDKVIRQQYAPKLRQKEEEITRRLGREVRLDPLQDPEFVAFYNQHITALKSNYEPVIEQAREEVKRLFEN